MNIKKYIVDYNVSIKQAMKALDTGAIGFLCVYKSNKIFGVITDGDIRRAILNDIPLKTPVSEITNTEYTFLNKDYTNTDVNNIFRKIHFFHFLFPFHTIQL